MLFSSHSLSVNSKQECQFYIISFVRSVCHLEIHCMALLQGKLFYIHILFLYSVLLDLEFLRYIDILTLTYGLK